MKDEQGEGRGPRRKGGSRKATTEVAEATAQTNQTIDAVENLDQIEYLIHQSTLGNHLLFNNVDIAPILSKPFDRAKFFTDENRKKVQSLLSRLLDCGSLEAKRSFLETLAADDFENLVHSYFQLVEQTILAHVDVRH